MLCKSYISEYIWKYRWKRSPDIDYNILYSKISYSDHFVNSITNNDLIIVLSNHPRGDIKNETKIIFIK